MATIKIKSSTVVVTESKARQLASLLSSCGISYSFDATSIEKNNILMKDVPVSFRLRHLLELWYENRYPNGHNRDTWYKPTGEWQTITIEDFINKFPKHALIKLQGIGKVYIKQLADALAEYGYEY